MTHLVIYCYYSGECVADTQAAYTDLLPLHTILSVPICCLRLSRQHEVFQDRYDCAAVVYSFQHSLSITLQCTSDGMRFPALHLRPLVTRV
jgi:hypothetical protein